MSAAACAGLQAGTCTGNLACWDVHRGLCLQDCALGRPQFGNLRTLFVTCFCTAQLKAVETSQLTSGWP